MNIIERMESNVRSYCRAFPTVFSRGEGATLIDADGRRYIDLFAGAGALNYGHNPPALSAALVAYITKGGVAHSLDMTTEAKCDFLAALDTHILAPRGMNYKVMFPGPTGTNAVESALKLARKVTGRSKVIAFTNAFHGMTLGALSVTGNAMKRAGAGVTLHDCERMPFCGYHGEHVDTADLIAELLDGTSSGVDAPAAVILETIQAEGGVNEASAAWLRRIAGLARDSGALLIVDDIQVGCGRTGPFFSFEQFGIDPDIICLSKSLSGFGLPMSVTLMRPELDAWEPGEHNGTFRGNNHAFVTARAAIDAFWRDDALTLDVERRAELVRDRLEALATRYGGTRRGRGLIQGVAFDDETFAARVSAEAFRHGVVIETAGPSGEVLKALPPLVIPDETLIEALDVVAAAADTVSRATRVSTPTQGSARGSESPVGEVAL